MRLIEQQASEQLVEVLMFANALNRLMGWWKGTLDAERSFLGIGGGPGCPPISNEQQLKRDLAWAAAWAAVLQSLKDSSPAMLANGDGLSRRSTESERSEAPCAIPPSILQAGWRCSRKAGHDGPCAMHPPGDA